MYKYYIFICICPIIHITHLSTLSIAYKVEETNSSKNKYKKPVKFSLVFS